MYICPWFWVHLYEKNTWQWYFIMYAGPSFSQELFSISILINIFRQPVVSARVALVGNWCCWRAGKLKCTKMKYCFNNCRSGGRRMRIFDLYSCQAFVIDSAVPSISVSVRNLRFSSLDNSIVCDFLTKIIFLDQVCLFYLVWYYFILLSILKGNVSEMYKNIIKYVTSQLLYTVATTW